MDLSFLHSGFLDSVASMMSVLADPAVDQGLIDTGVNAINNTFKIREVLKALTNWLMLIIPSGGVLMVGYFAFLKQTATDESTAQQYGKNIKTAIVSTALGTGASGLMSFLANFVRA